MVGKVISRSIKNAARGVSLIEGLIASLLLAIVAAGAATALGVGMNAQRDAHLQLLAGFAAEQQISTIMAGAYSQTPAWAGSEPVGAMLAPPRINASGVEVRDPMGSAFAQLGRVTTVVAETRTFAQYSNFSAPGWRIEVVVHDAAGRVYAQIIRFRAQEQEP